MGRRWAPVVRYHYLDGGVVPELPEVEIMAENARRWSQGRMLVDVEVIDHRIQAGQADLRELKGAVFGQAYRRGKYLVLPLGERALVFHFRMTGKLVPFEPGRRARLVLHLPERTLAFVDSRCLGQVWVLSVMDLEAFFVGRRLGPEPFPELRDGAWWCTVMLGLTGPLKNSLMRQDRVAGLGNIAASEVCWRARLHPEVPTHELSADDWETLARVTHAFLAETIAAERADEIRLVGEAGDGGRSEAFRVYRRTGSPCPRCTHLIERVVLAGRSTFFCGVCQRWPAAGSGAG